MSSRTAVCGQPPVSTAAMRSAGSAWLRTRNSRVLPREDVVGDDGEAVVVAQRAAEREQQRGLAAADRTADADGEGARGDSRGRAARRARRRRPAPSGSGRARDRADDGGSAGQCIGELPVSGLKQPRVEPVVRRLQQVEERRGLREVVARRARAQRSATSSSIGAACRAAAAAPRSCRRCRAARPPTSTPRAAPKSTSRCAARQRHAERATAWRPTTGATCAAAVPRRARSSAVERAATARSRAHVATSVAPLHAARAVGDGVASGTRRQSASSAVEPRRDRRCAAFTSGSAA